MSEATEQFLVPTATLEAMARGIRLLRRRATAWPSLAGLEAVWTAVLPVLREGDLLWAEPAMASRDQLRQLAGAMTLEIKPRVLEAAGWDTESALAGVLGAAAAQKAEAAQRLVVAFVRRAALRDRSWRRVLAAAGGQDLPVVWVVVPEPEESAGGRLSAWSQQAGGPEGRGVPGMPVDAADAVALCRVLQESAGRARAGDGPALLEAVWWTGGGQGAGMGVGLAERDAAGRLRSTLRARAAQKKRHGRQPRTQGDV